MSQRVELTELEKEWNTLVSETHGNDLLWARGMEWLSKHCDDLAAGSAIETLIGIKSSERLIDIGKSWLKKFPTEYARTPVFVGQLLKCEQSPESIQLAAACLESATNPVRVGGSLLWEASHTSALA